METALEALPGRPLAAEDVATLNNAATVRVIPYTWFGEQVIAALLLHDQRGTDRDEIGEHARVTDSDPESGTETTSQEDNPFGGRDEGIGTVEVIEDEGFSDGPAGDGAEDVAEMDGSEDDLSVFAVGYDDSASSWVVIAEIDPDAEFTDAEAPIREWAESAYHEAIVDRLAIGPSEYELGHGREN